MGTASLAYDAVTAQQGVDRGLLATEGLVKLIRITAISLTEDFTAEAVGGCLREDPFFLEGCEGIGIQHFSPLVAVVARSVSP